MYVVPFISLPVGCCKAACSKQQVHEHMSSSKLLVPVLLHHCCMHRNDDLTAAEVKNMLLYCLLGLYCCMALQRSCTAAVLYCMPRPLDRDLRTC